jgi:hypothetical protein
MAALVSAMNQGLLKSPSFVWTVIVFGLLAMVMFWGPGKGMQTKPKASTDLSD